MRIITDHKLIYKVAITTLENIANSLPHFDNICSISLKLYGYIKRSSAGLAKLCLEGFVPGKRSTRKQMWGNKIIL